MIQVHSSKLIRSVENKINCMSLALTSYGEDNCEDQGDGAHNLALDRGGVDVVLQGKHDSAESGDICHVT